MLRAHHVPNAPLVRESEADVINGRA
jgi:hypothetical protein